MNLETYYKKIYALSHIQRYANVIRIKNEDVSQHSFFVAALVVKLHSNYEFDLGLALLAAVVHDLPEADISDVTHDIKHKFPKLAREIREAESTVILQYSNDIQHGFKIFTDCNTVEGLIANYADVIQVQQYINSEISLGNTTVDIVLISAKKRLRILKRKLEKYAKNS